MDIIELPDSNRQRRRLLQAGAGALALRSSGVLATVSTRRTIRFGLTPAFVHDRHTLMAEWRSYLEARLGATVEFLPRNSYRETMDLLHQSRLDFAWLCDYPFLYLKDLVRLLAVPRATARRAQPGHDAKQALDLRVWSKHDDMLKSLAQSSNT